MSDRDLKVAILCLKRGTPIPTDRLMRLAAQGVDLTALERKYAL